jgi:tRNA (cytidine32/uridine32-2'-O)-methyltransferase
VPRDEFAASEPRFVLVETSHPGNIGSAARAIRTMGFGRLVLVRPAHFPHADATALAAGADDVLAATHVCASLDEALADCVRVYGTSARARTLAWPTRDARGAAEEAGAGSGPVAFVFGRERSGLTNRELDRCHAMLHIPTGSGYASLNLAQAVQIVAYELRVALDSGARGASTPQPVADALPTHTELERFYHHLESTLTDIGFLDPANPKQLMRRLRRFFQRAQPDAVELNILRGILRNAADPEPGSATRRRLAGDHGGDDSATIGVRNQSPASGRE